MPPEDPGDLTLRVHRAAAAPAEVPGAYHLVLDTSRGEIRGVFHPVEGGATAVVCVGGAFGGLDGPSHALYADLPRLLEPAAVSVLRLHYRVPNNLEECSLDVLAGCSFLRGIGATKAVLVGHSFGGAVVITAGQLAGLAVGVVAISSQVYGTRHVEELGKPLLLLHGTADTILASEASEDIYRRARDPRRIVLFEEGGHLLGEFRDELREELRQWVEDCFDGHAATGRREVRARPPDDAAAP
jgi:dienelactone hydrolase